MGTINVVFPKALNEQRAETKIWKMAIPPDQNILVRLFFAYGISSKYGRTLPFHISLLQLSHLLCLFTHIHHQSQASLARTTDQPTQDKNPKSLRTATECPREQGNPIPSPHPLVSTSPNLSNLTTRQSIPDCLGDQSAKDPRSLLRSRDRKMLG